MTAIKTRHCRHHQQHNGGRTKLWGLYSNTDAAATLAISGSEMVSCNGIFYKNKQEPLFIKGTKWPCEFFFSFLLVGNIKSIMY